MGILVTPDCIQAIDSVMHSKWYHKLLLCLILSALTAGIIQFFQFFIVGAQREMDKGIRDRTVLQP